METGANQVIAVGRTPVVVLRVTVCGFALVSGGRHCDQLMIFDRRRERAEKFAQFCNDLAGDASADIKVAATARAAISSSDVIIAATTTTTPYVDADWVRPGSVLVNVPLDDLSRDPLVGCDRLFVGDWELIVSDEHRLPGRLRRGSDSRPWGSRRRCPRCRRHDRRPGYSRRPGPSWGDGCRRCQRVWDGCGDIAVAGAVMEVDG